MKLLCSVHEAHEASNICHLLESNGIPVVRTNVNTHGMIKGAKMKIDLWVGVEGQYSDALALMENPQHQVASPVNVAEFHQILAEIKSQAPIPALTGERFLNIAVSVGLAAFFAWVLWAIVTAK